MRLGHLDGIRGLTSLAVVLTHVYWQVCPHGDAGALPTWLALTLRPIAFAGKVSIFMALSGFCLMLSALRRETSIREFFLRRARRVLPGYYAALALCLGLTALIPWLRVAHDERWALALPAFSKGALIPHLLLIHNLSPNWTFKIDPPLWAFAIEAQLYVAFALILLPLYRRFGWLAMLTAGTILGFAPLILLSDKQNLFWTCPWYALVFCFGAVGAAWRENRIVQKYAGVGVGLLATLFAAQVLAGDAWHAAHPIRTDLLTGLFAVSLMVGPPKTIVQFLESRPLRWLGETSYSLYLVHFPLIALVDGGIRTYLPALAPEYRLGLLSLLSVPLSLAVARGFHRVIP